ncbi:MAG: hypothetical protein AABY16_02075 [Nanoarchaeota archaeon]
MKIISKKPEKIILRTEMNYSLLNTIRRSVEEIQTLAINEVEIYKNDSVLYDEVLAHRMGLVPLRTESKMSAKTNIELALKKTGPCTVYSGDFKGDAKIVYEKIPLTILEKDQEIELVATAAFGTGISHTKHVPGIIYYRYLFEVKSGNSKIDAIVQTTRGEISPEKSGSKWICDLTDAQADEIRMIDPNSIVDAKEILLIVESFGVMDADKIFTKAIEVLENNLVKFEELIK